MAKFFEGQLVRVVGYNSFPELVGRECVIRRIGVISHNLMTGSIEYDVIQTDISSPSNPLRYVGFSADHLEPILYDGAQPIAESFEEMMGKLREGVVA